jgi:hypothetical protein
MYVNIFFGFVFFSIVYYYFLDIVYRKHIVHDIKKGFYEDPSDNSKK